MSVFRHFSILQKLAVSFLAVIVVSVSVISGVYYYTFKQAIIQRTTDQLRSINILKKIQVEDYLKQHQSPSLSFIEYIMHQRTGMGNSGESYVVGSDSLLLTSSRFFPNQNPREIFVASMGVKNALAGKSGDGIYIDYRGVMVIGAFGSIHLNGQHWAILSEMDFEEAMLPVYRTRNYFIFFGCIVVLVVAFVSFWMARLLSIPIVNLNSTIRDISVGKLPELGHYQHSPNEIEDMGFSLHQLIDALRNKTSFAKEIGQGKFDTQFSPSTGSLDELGNALVDMRDDLLRLKEADKRLLRLRSAALIEGEERERKRLAMDLHDGLGQLLTAIKFRVDALDDTQENKPQLQQILNESIMEVRRIAHNVMPTVLVDFGLKAALKRLCAMLEKDHQLQISMDFSGLESDSQIDFAIGICLYRIAQEALTNILKHAHSTSVVIILSKDNDRIRLKIMDDGIGFDKKVAEAKGHHGLGNMRERAKLLNGTFSCISFEGKGTEIVVELPL